MSKLSWYWHRLRAMNPGEMLLHARKKLRQVADARRTSWPEVDLTCSGAFPKLPKPEDAPEVLREALRRDVENILAGRWRFFGHLEVQVDDPPKWQFDYLVRRDVESSESAFRLNYRSLSDGVDSKLVWEPSRWNQLVRLAMASYVLGDRRAGEKCVEWLEDWVKHNPPYRGWNWTSALEVGLRLIQFAWMDELLTSSSRRNEAQSPGWESKRDQSLLTSAATIGERLERLRQQILPPHVCYAWRHKSFGSSANNHLLGELIGCIVATARWPVLAKCGASLEELQRRWEHEVLAQFAEDGGNKEQALNYQLFSWEFCWQARMALLAAGRAIPAEIERRLALAADFFREVSVGLGAWDYGDSDCAFVTPFFERETDAVSEWVSWMIESRGSPALAFWLGSSPELLGLVASALGLENHPTQQACALQLQDEGSVPAGDRWRIFPTTGIGVGLFDEWTLRWDASALGYGATAAHGHLDVLHLSVWLEEQAMVIDPGTGAYYGDTCLRTWLASRGAHNGPSPAIDPFPKRRGLFLWSECHPRPILTKLTGGEICAELALPSGCLRRVVKCVSDDEGFLRLEKEQRPGDEEPQSFVIVEDVYHSQSDAGEFSVRWQFAPDCVLQVLERGRFLISCVGAAMEVQVSPDWAEVWCVTEQSQVAKADPDAPLAGTVSPAFRKVVWAPYLKLVARPQGDKPCVFSTTFLASAHS
jgi:hypothetical protein